MSAFVLAPLGLLLLGGIYLVARLPETGSQADHKSPGVCCGRCPAPCAENSTTSAEAETSAETESEVS